MDADEIEKSSDHESPVVITVFIAKTLTERLIVVAEEGDTPEQVRSRQRYIDVITSYSASV